jgi:hypothetical protein
MSASCLAGSHLLYSDRTTFPRLRSASCLAINVTPSKLWLNKSPKVQVCRLLGSVTPAKVWLCQGGPKNGIDSAERWTKCPIISSFCSCGRQRFRTTQHTAPPGSPSFLPSFRIFWDLYLPAWLHHPGAKKKVEPSGKSAGDSASSNQWVAEIKFIFLVCH